MTSTSTVVADQWQQFLDRVLCACKDGTSPETPGADYLEQHRRTFYAGAYCTMSGLMDIMAGERGPTEADMFVMEDLFSELETFAAQHLKQLRGEP